MNLGSFFSELKRREVVRMAALYPCFQPLWRLPAAAEKDAAHE